ncbi:MAG: hypothetical protein H0W50_03915 [Parachlamydiaceae bacterium]|nr:hypothetical protein [Parachlamydiaceae bacterium]
MGPISTFKEMAFNYYTGPVDKTKEKTSKVSKEIINNNGSNDINNINNKSIEPQRAKKIEGNESSWNAVIADLSHFVVLDVVGLKPNEGYIENTSIIIKDVLLFIGSMNGKSDLPLQFDDQNFGRHLIAGILRFVSELDLAQHNPETKEGEDALRKDLSIIFDRLIENAGLGEEEIKSKPQLLQEAFYPSALINFGFNIVSLFKDLPDIGRKNFEKNFVEIGVEMCKVQKNIEAKSKDPILDLHKDSSKFANFIVEDWVMPLVKAGEISIDLPLRKKNNKDFVLAELNTILSENQELKKTIQEVISAVVNELILNPKLIGVERQNVLIDSVLERLIQESVLADKDKDLLKEVILNQLNPEILLREYPALSKEGNEKFLASLGIPPYVVIEEDKNIIDESKVEKKEFALSPIDFLSSIIFKGLPCLTQSEKDRRIVDQSLDMIENQLRMCMKAILSVILTPTKVGETPEDRRTNLLNGILDRFATKFTTYQQELDTIDKLNQKGLKNKLESVSKNANDPIYFSDAKTLIDRSNTSDAIQQPFKIFENWDSEAQELIQEAWIEGDQLNKDAKKDITAKHNNLIGILEGWENQETLNRNWRFEYSNRAKLLLAKKDVTWEMEARQILKQIEANKLAKFSLENELNPEKFSNLFSKLLPADKILPLIYKEVGEKFLKFHEHTLNLSQQGKIAEDFIKKTNVKELPELINVILNASVETIEEMAEKNEIDLGFSFLNDAASNLLKKSNGGGEPLPENDNDSPIMKKPLRDKAELILKRKLSAENSSNSKFKEQTKSMVKDILMIVLSNTIERNTIISLKVNQEKNIEGIVEGNAQENILEADDAFANVIDKFLQDALSNFELISDTCLAFQKLNINEKQGGLLALANSFGIEKIKFEKSPEALDIHYRNLLLKDLARKLTADIVPKELFNSLLPEEFRKSELWEKIADKMFAPYVTGIYEKTIAFREAEEQIDSTITNPFLLSPEDKECFGPLINDIVKSVEEKLPNLDLGGILEDQFKKTDKGNVDFSVLDRLFGNAIKKNGEFAKLIGSSLPKIIESILAFHLNSNEDGLSSQERATELIWKVIKTMEDGFAGIDALKASCEVVLPEEGFDFTKALSKESIAAYRKEMTIQSDVPDSIELYKACYVWIQDEVILSRIKKQITQKDMAAYRKQMNIDASDSPALFKECYVWAQSNKILDQFTTKLLDLIVPKDLWNRYVAEQFGDIIPRAQVGKWLIDYLKEGYEHSNHMKELVSQGKGTVINQEDKWAGLGTYIDKKMGKILKDFLKKDDQDSPHIEWFKDVLGRLMDRETDKNKPVSNMISSSIYAILGKVLSGGLASSLTSSQMFINSRNFDVSPIAKDTLIGKLAEMIPEIREDCYKLNALQEGQKCSSFNRLTAQTVLPYLSVAGGSLGKNEIVKTFPEEFSFDPEGRVVVEITIVDTKKNIERKVLVDVNKFVHWDIAYNAIDTLVTDEDWNELVPSLAKSLVTKELIAGFVAPYIETFHQIQEPFQKKAEKGEALVAIINAESSDYQDCMAKIDVMRSAWESASVNDPFFRENITIEEIAEYRRKMQMGPEVPVTPEMHKECYLYVQSNRILKESKSDITVYILDKIYSIMDDIAIDEKKISPKLPDFLDKLVKGFLSKTADNNIKDAREVLIKRAVNLLLGEVLLPAEGSESATQRSAENIRNKLNNILKVTLGSTGKTIAQKIVDEFLPESTWNEIFQGKFKDLITRKDIIDEVEKFLALGNFENLLSKKTSIIDAVANKFEDALSELFVLDLDIEEKERAANLSISKGGGLVEMVKVICDSIDETIDEYAEKDKVAELPSLFNGVAIEVLKDKKSSQALKDSSRALVTIAIARMLKTKPNQTQEARVFELLGSLIKAYDSENPASTAQKWIEEFFPNDLRREILPTALYDILTPKFFSELIIKEYAAQFEVVKDALASAPIDDADHNVSQLQAFVKGKLIDYKNPKFSRDGLVGMGGFVKALEGMIIGAMSGKGEGVEVGEVIESILNTGIAKVMDGPQVKKLLDKQFMAEALSAALPTLGNGPVAPGFPKLSEEELSDLSPDSLKKLKIDIKRGDLKADFKQRVVNRHFELESAKKLTEILFPNGAKDLPVPEVAQPSGMNKATEILADQIAKVTNRDQRVLMAIDLLGVSDSDKGSFQVLEDHLKANNNLVGHDRVAENLFKKGLVSFAMKKIDENVCKNWIQPFKWLAVSFVKAIAWCALKIGINRQAWNYISNPANDEKLRGFVWTFLSFASTYKPTKRTRQELDEFDKQLGVNFKGALGDMGLVHGLQWIVAPKIAGEIKNKNLIDLIV